MVTNQNDSQFGQGSRIDDTQRENSNRYYGTEESTNDSTPNKKNDDTAGFPGRDNNTNIGGNENEYDNTKQDEDHSNPASEDNFQSTEDSNQERRDADTYLNTDIDITKTL